MEPSIGWREVAALALAAVAIAVTLPYLSPQAQSGTPRPVVLDTPSPPAGSPIAGDEPAVRAWTIEIVRPGQSEPQSLGEAPQLDVLIPMGPVEIVARTTLFLPHPGSWTLLIEHNRPLTVEVDGLVLEQPAPEIPAGSSVTFQHEGGAVQLTIRSKVDGPGALRLSFVGIR